MTNIEITLSAPRIRIKTIEKIVQAVVENTKRHDVAATLTEFLATQQLEFDNKIVEAIKTELETIYKNRISFSATVPALATSRSDRLETAISDFESALEDAKSEVNALKDEIEEWKSGMEGTNLENSEKFSQLEECYDSLEEIVNDLDGIDVPDSLSVDFPGMY